MNFMKRAWLAIKAKKGRSTLLILVTSAILIFVLAGLTIKNAADSAVKSAKSEAGATVSLSVNREAMMKAFNPEQDSDSDNAKEASTATTSVDLATAKSIAKKTGVASYLFTTTTTATAGDGISAISTSSTSDSKNDTSQETSDKNQPPSRGDMKMTTGDFTITGVNDLKYVGDFTSGTSKITDGRGITSDTANNAVVISSDLAKKNNFSVGSKFTVTTTVNDTETTHQLTIVGIYENSSTATTAQMMSNASNPQNNIYTNLTTANTLKGETDKLDSAVYTLSNPEEMDQFVKEVKSEINTDSYSVTSSDEIYEQMLSPLNNISAIAQNIVILVATAGAVILTLIIVLSIRERRYEIGVLMSLGENRRKIVGQFFMELFMVTAFSLFIASFAGNFVGNALGNQLLSSTSTEQTTTKKDNQPEQKSGNPRGGRPQEGGGPSGGTGGMRGMVSMVTSSTEEIDKLNIKLTGEDIAKLGGIALFISFISTILASVGIIRMKPKDILSTN